MQYAKIPSIFALTDFSVLKRLGPGIIFRAIFMNVCFQHFHKKRKDSLEGSLNRELFVAELEFPKILVPRLPQNTSNINAECARKSKQLHSLCDQLIRALIYLNFTILILICF